MFWFIIKWGRFLINQVEDYQQIATQGSASREATHRKYLLFILYIDEHCVQVYNIYSRLNNRELVIY